MKKLNLLVVTLILVIQAQSITAQTLNWRTLDPTKHIINASYGLDYSMSLGLGYSYKLQTKIPIILGVNFSTPTSEIILDDFKTKIGGQVVFLNKSNFIGSASIYGIYRRNETNFLTLKNFGSETKASFGYYQPKWFVSAAVGFDKAIVTHFKHSQFFRDNIYADVVDGWYEPATGGNFFYGLQTGYSLKKLDFTLDFGKVISQNFKTSPMLPFYGQFGVNFRW